MVALYFNASCHAFRLLTSLTVTLIVKDWPGATVICVGETDMLVPRVPEMTVLVQAPRRSITMVPRRSVFNRFA